MNELRYQITQIIFLVVLGLGLYWAFTHLDSGVSYARPDVVGEVVQDSNPEQIPEPSEETPSEETPSEEQPEEPTESTPEPSEETPVVSAENTALVSALQKLIDDQVYMKSGSRGTRVGTVQKFLDYYFDDKNVSADNDYGPGTRDLVRQFQSENGLTADGQAGPSTYQKMISLLK